jgi:SpoIID/LytB domain protein
MARRPLHPTSPLGPLPRLRLHCWLLGGLVFLSGGCQASDRPLSPPALPPLPSGSGAPLAADRAPLHWPVSPPPAIQADQPVLWVALAARLGPKATSTSEASEAAPLRLQAAAGALTLVDGAGQRFAAPTFTLQWRWLPLAQPFTLRRRVLGPFASYESAEAAARRWAAAGAQPRIARPAEWEVWAAAESPLPADLPTRLLERRETRRLVLELRRPEGAVALQGPIRIEAPAGLLWQNGRYGGPFRLLADAHGGWSLLEEVPLERYLEGVVPHEIGAGAPPAALAAQAVLARTWALRNRSRYGVDGFHLCADTQCQVYSDPGQASAAVRAAIAATRGQVLTAGAEPIQAVYHASNGGVAAGLEEAWDTEPVPYLRPFVDAPEAAAGRWPLPLAASALPSLLQGDGGAYGADHPRFRWQRQLTADRLGAALQARGSEVGQVQTLQVLQRGASGRVVALQIGGTAGSVVLRRDAIRRTLRDLPSTLFTLTPAGAGLWRVEGGGFGHGAGLSQAGAIDLGRRGWSAQRILLHYYPGTALEPLEAIGAFLRSGG